MTSFDDLAGGERRWVDGWLDEIGECFSRVTAFLLGSGSSHLGVSMPDLLGLNCCGTRSVGLTRQFNQTAIFLRQFPNPACTRA